MSDTTTNTLGVEASTLYYEMRGSGPVLLCIPGGPARVHVVGRAGQLCRRSSIGAPAGWRSLRRAVRVVIVPPLIRRGLRVAVRRVFPFLLAAERGDVEIVPAVPHLLVATVVDEIRA